MASAIASLHSSPKTGGRSQGGGVVPPLPSEGKGVKRSPPVSSFSPPFAAPSISKADEGMNDGYSVPTQAPPPHPVPAPAPSVSGGGASAALPASPFVHLHLRSNRRSAEGPDPAYKATFHPHTFRPYRTVWPQGNPQATVRRRGTRGARASAATLAAPGGVQGGGSSRLLESSSMDFDKAGELLHPLPAPAPPASGGSPPPLHPRAHLLLLSLTCELPELYARCNPAFTYNRQANPRRVLTEPSERCGNGGHDNAHANLVLSVNDVLHSDVGLFRSFRVLELLGEGTFGQVVKAEDCATRVLRAVKVIKNKPAYYQQALMEIRLLTTLNTQYDAEDRHHMLRLLDHFTYKHHLCLVFELLSVNLYELIKQNQFRGLAMHLIRTFLSQLTDALIVLRQANVIHCLSDDSRLLTEHGFLPLDAVRRRWREVRIACYDPHTQQLRYEYATAFTGGEEAGPHAMVRFTHPHTALSLLVTDGHDVYVQRQVGGVEGVEGWAPPEKVKARDLVETVAGPQASVRFLTCAAGGVKVEEKAVGELPFVGALGLRDQGQVDAFLELYGFWLGDGRLTEGNGVCFGGGRRHHTWLEERVAAVGLPAARLTESQQEEGEAEVVVHDRRWFDYLASEYGVSADDLSTPSLSRTPSPVDEDDLSIEDDDGSDSDVDLEDGYGEQSASRWFMPWVLSRLDKPRVRLLLSGYRRSAGADSHGRQLLFTVSARLRDELIIALLHAGYAASFAPHRRRKPNHRQVCEGGVCGGR